MEKRGDITEKSHSDFSSDFVKYADENSPYLAGEKDKHLLQKPIPLFNGPKVIEQNHLKQKKSN